VFLECLEGLKLGKEKICPPQLKKYCRDELRVFLDDITPSKLELERSQFQLSQTQIELERSQNMIKAMESSKFWKLRKALFLVKQLIFSNENKSKNQP
jgi:hypothetical protein